MATELPQLSDTDAEHTVLEVKTFGAFQGPEPMCVDLLFGDGERKVILRFPHKGVVMAYATALLDELHPAPDRQILETLQRIEAKMTGLG